MTSKKPIVFIICPGLGHVNRGFESFTKECFEALKDNKEFEIYLFKGGGKEAGKEAVLPNLQRSSFIAKCVGKLFHSNSYTVEQFTFSISLLPALFKKRPSVIYYSDSDLGFFLWKLRYFFKFKYMLLFSNGTPYMAPYKIADHVQQLLPVYLQDALDKGESYEKQTLLPYGFNININERITAIKQKKAFKKQLGIKPHQKIVLSVGAVNKRHKRMDYIINELAALNDDYFLVMIGQFEKETTEIVNFAESKLAGKYIIKTVPHTEVEKYYVIADFFVLASLREGLPRVTVEALSFGLICIVHDYAVTRQVLKQYGSFIDMNCEGALSNYLSKNDYLQVKFDRTDLIKIAYELYSWDKLKDKYINMISKQILDSN